MTERSMEMLRIRLRNVIIIWCVLWGLECSLELTPDMTWGGFGCSLQSTTDIAWTFWLVARRATGTGTGKDSMKILMAAMKPEELLGDPNGEWQVCKHNSMKRATAARKPEELSDDPSSRWQVCKYVPESMGKGFTKRLMAARKPEKLLMDSSSSWQVCKCVPENMGRGFTKRLMAARKPEKLLMDYSSGWQVCKSTPESIGNDKTSLKGELKRKKWRHVGNGWPYYMRLLAPSRKKKKGAANILLKLLIENIVILNTMAIGYVHHEYAGQADVNMGLGCLGRMQKGSVGSDKVRFAGILEACASGEAIAHERITHKRMLDGAYHLHIAAVRSVKDLRKFCRKGSLHHTVEIAWEQCICLEAQMVQRQTEIPELLPSRYVVVGFEITPCSVQHNHNAAVKLRNDIDGQLPEVICDMQIGPLSMVNQGEFFTFSYEVEFEKNFICWPPRWDSHLKMGGTRIHWFSILNSLMVIAFLAGIVFVIFLRTVRRDLTKYEELDKPAHAQMTEELSGWKLVVGDVFRAPSHPQLLCIMVGNGAQILGMAVVTTLFAALGFMFSASNDMLLTGMILLYLFLGIAASYVACRLWRAVEQGCRLNGNSSAHKQKNNQAPCVVRDMIEHGMKHEHDLQDSSVEDVQDTLWRAMMLSKCSWRLQSIVQKMMETSYFWIMYWSKVLIGCFMWSQVLFLCFQCMLSRAKVLQGAQVVNLMTISDVVGHLIIDMGDGADPWEPGSYDLALEDAGIHDFNITLYTSVISPEATRVDYEEAKWFSRHGAVMESIISTMYGGKGDRITAVVARIQIRRKDNHNVVGGSAAEYKRHGEEKIAGKILDSDLSSICKRRFNEDEYEVFESEYMIKVGEVTKGFGTVLAKVKVHFKTGETLWQLKKMHGLMIIEKGACTRPMLLRRVGSSLEGNKSSTQALSFNCRDSHNFRDLEKIVDEKMPLIFFFKMQGESVKSWFRNWILIQAKLLHHEIENMPLLHMFRIQPGYIFRIQRSYGYCSSFVGAPSSAYGSGPATGNYGAAWGARTWGANPLAYGSTGGYPSVLVLVTQQGDHHIASTPRYSNYVYGQTDSSYVSNPRGHAAREAAGYGASGGAAYTLEVVQVVLQMIMEAQDAPDNTWRSLGDLIVLKVILLILLLELDWTRDNSIWRWICCRDGSAGKDGLK